MTVVVLFLHHGLGSLPMIKGTLLSWHNFLCGMEKDKGVEGSSSLHVLVYLAGMKSKCA